MKKFTFIIISILCLTSSCSNKAGLAPIAENNLPDLLDTEMRDYMGTVEKPVIKDLVVVFDCDSLCILQCHASAKDANGSTQSESIRYAFVKDTFLSACNGKDVYCHLVQGATYLDKKGIEEFHKKMKDYPQQMYTYYLSNAKSLKLFE